MIETRRRLRQAWGAFAAAGLVLASAWLAAAAAGRLGRPAVPTGWLLLGALALLAAFSLRKRLSVLPLGTAAGWLRLHLALGLGAVALFWLHAGGAWPLGGYERALAALFWLVTATGVAGHLLQKSYPRRLTATGVEVLYERIPEELARLRAEAEALTLECAAETGSETLSRHYLEKLDWFFRRPRFFLSHALGFATGRQWVRFQIAAVRRYLDKREAAHLDRLVRLAYYKNDLDLHYAAQGIMKGWLLLHLPLAAALAVLALWHVLLVHVYAL